MNDYLIISIRHNERNLIGNYFDNLLIYLFSLIVKKKKKWFQLLKWKDLLLFFKHDSK